MSKGIGNEYSQVNWKFVDTKYDLEFAVWLTEQFVTVRVRNSEVLQKLTLYHAVASYT